MGPTFADLRKSVRFGSRRKIRLYDDTEVYTLSDQKAPEKLAPELALAFGRVRGLVTFLLGG